MRQDIIVIKEQLIKSTSFGLSTHLDGIGAAYKVEIVLDKLPDEIKIGMEGNCDIIIGKRTVLDYFLEPFIEGIEGSLKED